MARKNLLEGLTAVKSTPETEAEASALPRRTSGAIGAVGRSFAQMRENAVVEVPADMIDAAGLSDRLGDDPDQAALTRSIEEYGQQVPVLLRHSPNVEGRYEIVYGRRRVVALRALRRPVRAMVRDLPDRSLIVAQGQENTARKNLSFVELANFARQMRDMGFERKVIQDALHLHEAVVSKMLTVADRVPPELIAAIGDAPRTGRDRWVAFSKALAGHADAALAAVEAAREADADSDARFEAALATTRSPAPRKAAQRAEWGSVRQTTRGTTISLDQDQAFADWLVARMDDLHRDWQVQAGTDGESNQSKEE
ncbi:plasmid partitioning protein RepB [uncultured Jannaschia sp.]|uniref:plasmid partitioning protein RepB n=1 Tax=uncultured Jannaschia sp. TaxID=293347 RepID=UPI002617D99F|nr:plasmid partitioning protein RepB [uncultured Jannaschia sp.]